MPNYKELYFEMVRGTEKAINILIDTQRKCEELYINSPDPEITVLPAGGDDPEGAETAPVL